MRLCFDVVEYLVGGFGPDKWFAAVVPAVDKPASGGDENADRAEGLRRMACQVMIPKKISTRLSQDPEAGVKCNWIRGFSPVTLARPVFVGSPAPGNFAGGAGRACR
jgi:hypothetical protein